MLQEIYIYLCLDKTKSSLEPLLSSSIITHTAYVYIIHSQLFLWVLFFFFCFFVLVAEFFVCFLLKCILFVALFKAENKFHMHANISINSLFPYLVQSLTKC